MSLLSLLFLSACDRDGRDFWVNASNVEPVVDLGTIETIAVQDIEDNDSELTGLPGLVYAQVGAADNPSTRSGASFQFFGTGGPVCLFLDPEAIFWNQSISEEGGTYTYEDRFTDDGDLDMYAGLSAYYTGSPGVQIGDFKLPYTDPLGIEHTIDFNECNRDVTPNGRATYERCEINTENRVGIPFTVLLRVFSHPIDDGVLNFGVAVVDGPCEGGFRPSECSIRNEVGLGEDVDGFGALEDAFCGPDFNDYCESYLASNPNDPNPPCTEGYIPSY